jgi:membrane protein YqaA with SNARE-associated domain
MLLGNEICTKNGQGNSISNPSNQSVNELQNTRQLANTELVDGSKPKWCHSEPAQSGGEEPAFACGLPALIFTKKTPVHAMNTRGQPSRTLESLKSIGHLLARYTAWIWSLLQVVGIWGPFAIALADSALLGMPVDAIVAAYVYNDHKRLLFYVATASLGSVLGSVPLYLIGYAGGEAVLRKRISEQRFHQIHESFEKHEFWALMLPGMMPPPTPFKIFVLAAAAFEMRFRDFAIAIFAARFVRFLAVGLLTLRFGPQIVSMLAYLFRRHFAWIVAAIGAGLLAWLLIRRSRRPTGATVPRS